jgi:hypothetical protein
MDEDEEVLTEEEFEEDEEVISGDEDNTGKGGKNKGQGGGGQGGQGGPLPRSYQMTKEDLSMSNSNVGSYIIITNTKYESIPVTAILFVPSEKTGEIGQKNKKQKITVLQSAFENIANEVTPSKPPNPPKIIPSDLDGIYFREMNINAKIKGKEQKKGEQQQQKQGKSLLDGMIELANKKNFIYKLLRNRPRWDPDNSKIVEEEEKVENDSNIKYNFTINIDGKTMKKYPFIIIYRGTQPDLMYEGPFGEASPDNPEDPEYINQVKSVTEILRYFLIKYGLNSNTTFNDSSELIAIRKDLWSRYKKGDKKDVNLFNFFSKVRLGQTIPALPIIMPPPEVPRNLLGQELVNTEEGPYFPTVIKIVPPTKLQFRKEDFPKPTNDEERKRIDEERKKYNNAKKEFEEEQKKNSFDIPLLYMPAIPVGALNDKGEFKKFNIDNINGDTYKLKEQK